MWSGNVTLNEGKASLSRSFEQRKEGGDRGREGGVARGVEMAGGLDVHKNKYVEDWGTARENLEKSFRFTRKNVTLALIFGIAVPFITYKGITGEFVSTWVVLNLNELGERTSCGVLGW